MRRIGLIRTAGVALTCMVAVVGCKKETTVSTPAGTVTVDEDGKTVAMKGPQGQKVVVKEAGDDKAQTVTITGDKGEKIVIASKTGKVPTEKELGVPLYPGAKADDSSSVMINAKGPGKTGGYGVWVFKTGDAFDKVFAFYKSKVKSARTFEMAQDGKKTGMLMVARKGVQQTVQVQRDGDQTVITISRVGGSR